MSITLSPQEVAIYVYTADDGTVVATTQYNTPADQTEVNAGTISAKFVSPVTLKNRDDQSGALTDAATIDITGPKHTLSTSTGRTFTISHAGDSIILVITLSASSATMTFPSAAKCISDGTASGDNTLSLAGVSGDEYLISIVKIGTKYYVGSANLGQ